MANELLTSNTKRAYPFAEDTRALAHAQNDVTYTPAPTMAVGAFVDAGFDLSPVTDYGPVYLKQISWSASTPQQQNIRFLCGTTNFDIPVDLDLWDLDRAFQYLEAQIGESTLRLVLSTADYIAFINGCPLVGPIILLDYTTTLPLDPHVVTFRSKEVRSILVGSDACVGDLKLAAGYNVGLELSRTVDTGNATDITIKASPGLGAGLVPCEEQVTTNNTLRGLAGSIQIEGDDCIEIAVDPVTRQITVINVCEACCSCTGYASAALNVLNDQTTIKTVYDTLEAGRLAYVSGVNHFNTYTIKQALRPPWVFAAQIGKPRRQRRETTAGRSTVSISEASRDMLASIAISNFLPNPDADGHPMWYKLIINELTLDAPGVSWYSNAYLHFTKTDIKDHVVIHSADNRAYTGHVLAMSAGVWTGIDAFVTALPGELMRMLIQVDGYVATPVPTATANPWGWTTIVATATLSYTVETWTNNGMIDSENYTEVKKVQLATNSVLSGPTDFISIT